MSRSQPSIYVRIVDTWVQGWVVSNFTSYFQRKCGSKTISQAGIHKMLVRIANREDPDQTDSEEAV